MYPIRSITLFQYLLYRIWNKPCLISRRDPPDTAYSVGDVGGAAIHMRARGAAMAKVWRLRIEKSRQVNGAGLPTEGPEVSLQLMRISYQK